jgi:hypothetical protein
MAIFPTKLLDTIVYATDSQRLQQFESRLSDYDVVKAFVDNTELLVPKAELEAAKKSSRHVAKLPVINKLDVTIGDSRACTPAGLDSTTAFVTPSYSTYSFSFDMKPSYYSENYIKYNQDFAHKLIQSLKAFGEALDSAGVAFLETNLTQVNQSPLFGGIVGDTVTVAASLKEEFYKSIPSILRRNDLSGARVLDIANPEAQIMYDSIARQGAGNSVNTAYQISNFAPYRSNRVLLDSGASETHYLVPEGHLGLLEWIPEDFRQGQMVSEGDLWSTIVDPIFGFTWALRYKAECSDLSGEAGGIADLTSAFRERFEFSIDIAFMTSYSSDTSSPIFKYSIAETDVIPS